MFDFELDTKWDVDKSTESLNNSLFGKIKKKKSKTLKIAESPHTKKADSDNAPDTNKADSDNENFSKKAKKKLKEKRRKNNKKERVTEKVNKGHEKLDILKVKKKAHTGEKSGIDYNEKRDPSKAQSVHNIKVKKTKKSVINSLLEQKGRKRKLSISEDFRDILGNHKAKKFKIDTHVDNKSELINKANPVGFVNNNNSGSQSDIENPADGMIKTKRKRKKKNTSQKNKLKQLALKSKMKPSLAVVCRENDLNTPCDLDSTKAHNLNKKNETRPFESKAPCIKSAETLETSSDRLDFTKNSSKQQKMLIQKSFIKKGKVNASGNQQRTNVSSTKQLLKKSKEKRKKSKGDKVLKQGKEMINESSNNGIAKGDKQKTDSISSGQNVSQNKKATESNPQISEAAPTLWGKAADLAQRAKDKLKSARFRFINEQLYTCTGSEAMKMFRSDRSAFNVYHEGYEKQVSKWPVNPLDTIIRQIKDKPHNLVVADFGCGDAKLAQSIPQEVHSFDLVATNSRVTACDMSKTPFLNESVDIAVFCLSLMGTNISDYVHEANRVLKMGGLLKIVEVVSRFSGLSQFISGVSKHGFLLLNKRDLNQMFYLIDFKKVKSVKKTSAGLIKLKPCVYKRR